MQRWRVFVQRTRRVRLERGEVKGRERGRGEGRREGDANRKRDRGR